MPKKLSSKASRCDATYACTRFEQVILFEGSIAVRREELMTRSTQGREKGGKRRWGKSKVRSSLAAEVAVKSSWLYFSYDYNVQKYSPHIETIDHAEVFFWPFLIMIRSVCT